MPGAGERVRGGAIIHIGRRARVITALARLSDYLFEFPPRQAGQLRRRKAA